jgi:hypothetical protein
MHLLRIVSSRRCASAVLAALVVMPIGCAQVTPSQATLQPTSATTAATAKLPALNLPRFDEPSNFRNWSPDQAVLPYAEYDEADRVTIHNIRNCEYKTETNYDVRHYDKTYDLKKLNRVDFLRVPFPEMPDLAHTMLSFGFSDEEYLGVSVEIRKEKGEAYNPVRAMFNQYEIMYVLADERDLIGLRTNYRKNDVYLYETRATPEQARKMLFDVLARVNKLRETPEFYHTLSNNCTTNIVRHVNHLAPGRIKYDYRILLPGLSDRVAYEAGLLKTAHSFDETRQAARITDVAYRAREADDFSQRIRR